MPNTDSLEEVAQGIYNLVKDSNVGLQDTWYGDQDNVPRFPAACVEAGSKEREWAGAYNITMNQFTVYVTIYHGRVADTQLTRSECIVYAEKVEKKILEDKQLGGLVIQGLVNMTEPGYSTRGGALMYSTRLTWVGITKTMA